MTPERDPALKGAPGAADIVESPRHEPRLPPGQVLTDKWPVLHYGTVPAVDLASWDLRVDGLVAHPFTLSWREFQQLPRAQVRSDIHCVTRWSRYDNLWEGVAVATLLDRAQPKPEARFAVVHAEHDYTANLPLAALRDADVLLADRHDGEPLAPEHGWPLRLVVPDRYFWKSAKWVRRIELVADDHPGFWERNGYHNDADPWREERFSDW
ncbi:MAG TPA: sulfite oxidase-like oxidoreductase [Candidatus Eisenbacteria bacterium]|nr:sulfite oxidase-like oxidoreductase [Candidatus Eisenbacteria bacterium]